MRLLTAISIISTFWTFLGWPGGLFSIALCLVAWWFVDL